MSAVISVAPGQYPGYDITIENGLLDRAGEAVKPLTGAARVAIVSDSQVAPLYLARAVDSFRRAGFEVHSFSFPAGEPSKNLDTVSKILEFFCISRLTRSDIAVALGGGVCGDLTGFAAAVYLRGIDFVQLPTSFLSQVDSSVGGKTGCDLPFGKNLCGAFHNPLAVLIDPETLSTLPERYLRDGLSESIKAGAIRMPELFARFEAGIDGHLPEIILKSVQMKADVVQRDFTEQGERTLLNFGHTLGHAIERHENYCGHSHGEAVAIGMALITRASEQARLTEPGTAERLIACLTAYGLPTETDIPLARLAELCTSDKKSRNSTIRLVLISRIGNAFVKEIGWDKLYDFLKDGTLS